MPILADIMAFVPWEGFGPFESYDADETVAGGETLELAGLELDVIFTPGHSPGHVTYSVRDEDAIFSGDVLFQGSVGRVDLPGGDGPTLIESIRSLVDSHPDRDRGLPRPHGHDDPRRRAGDATRSSPSWRASARFAPVRSRAAMASKFQAPRGTFDVLPASAPARARVLETAAGDLRPRRLRRIATPAFEDTELFERGVGKSTDIVQKEMFTFEDKGGRSLTLRPEGTAPICRAYLEHGMHKLAQPVKLHYAGPFFRHERPQAGRYRQFHQIGAEAIGSDSPLADAESITLLADLLAELGVPGVELRLGSLGSLDSRRAYLEELKAHLHANEASSLEGGPRAHRHQPAARLRRRRRGHPRGDGERADDRRAARRRGRRPLRRGPGPARRGRGRAHDRHRPWSAASTTTRGRSSPSSARGSARSRRSAAAAATTA